MRLRVGPDIGARTLALRRARGIPSKLLAQLEVRRRNRHRRPVASEQVLNRRSVRAAGVPLEHGAVETKAISELLDHVFAPFPPLARRQVTEREIVWRQASVGRDQLMLSA